jgi:hypothetical protein
VGARRINYNCGVVRGEGEGRGRLAKRCARLIIPTINCRFTRESHFQSRAVRHFSAPPSTPIGAGLTGSLFPRTRKSIGTTCHGGPRLLLPPAPSPKPHLLRPRSGPRHRLPSSFPSPTPLHRAANQRPSDDSRGWAFGPRLHDVHKGLPYFSPLDAE